MSHTGSIIHPTGSPGIIRVITTGYVVNNDNILEFRKPSLVPYDEKDKINNEYGSHEGLKMFQAQERYILFIDGKNSALSKLNNHQQSGLGVNFNIKFYKNYSKSKQWTSENWDEEVTKLESKVNDLCGIKNFKFRYIADDVESLNDDFVLYKFFELIKLWQYKTFESIIDKFKFTEEFTYNYKRQINCTADGTRGNSNNQSNNNQYYICKVRIRSATEFDHLYDPPEIIGNFGLMPNSQIKVCSNVIKEIELDENNEHKRSSILELPTVVSVTDVECTE